MLLGHACNHQLRSPESYDRAYAALVQPAPIDEPTAQFLEAAALDLQRQLGIAGDVEMISMGRTPSGIGLRARIRVAERSIDVEGFGETILAAHADICRRVAEPTLVVAFRQLVEP
jgi:hypothetical protein